MSGFTISHAQPLAPGSEAGQFVASPLLSPVEAELEAVAFTDGPLYIRLQALENVELGLYAHHITVTSGPPHMCTEYLVRLVKPERERGSGDGREMMRAAWYWILPLSRLKAGRVCCVLASASRRR